MIGLCLAFETQNNYGTQLQAYATVKAIEALGYEVGIIIYHKEYGVKDYIKGIKRLFLDDSIKQCIKKYKKGKLLKGDTSFAKNYNIRREKVRKFKEKYFFPKSKTYTGYEELCKGANNYSTILSGSDQVWLPAGYASKFYTMMFVPDNIPKMSYASSFGVSDIPSYHRKEAYEFLNRLEYISVREIKGKELVKKYSGCDAMVVVDPTMLISKRDWESMCVELNEQKYIFCYFLGTSRESRMQAEILKKKTGLKIVVLKHLDEYIPEDESFGDYSPYNIGPEEFISYIKNAEYVLTDSFHGTVFSIIFQKQFMTFYRFKNNDRMSKNSRIDSLLEQLNIMSRIYKNGDIVEQIKRPIEYSDIDNKLIHLRNTSRKFLEESLGRCQKKYVSQNK